VKKRHKGGVVGTATAHRRNGSSDATGRDSGNTRGEGSGTGKKFPCGENLDRGEEPVQERLGQRGEKVIRPGHIDNLGRRGSENRGAGENLEKI